jgi:hypothetical protein
MNCLEFRREKLADPRRLSDPARSHAQGCSACAALAREVDETEQALDRALQTPVPEGLAERIIFRSRKPQPAWRAWALAASLAAAAGVGFFLGTSRQPADAYARLAIEHVVREPESFTTVKEADPQAFQTAVQSLGASVKELPGKIRYIKLCPIEDGQGWHIVFETPEGPATLILVPGKRLPRIETASSAGWNALARPVRGGYYAIVTDSPAATSSFEKLLRERVIWDA